MKKSCLLISLFCLFLFNRLISQQSPTPDASLNPSGTSTWQDSTWRNCMQDNNFLLSFDYLQDATMDILLVSPLGRQKTGYQWSVFSYYSSLQTYQEVFVSDYYTQVIKDVTLVDLNDRGPKELLLLQKEILRVVDLESFEELAVIDLTEYDRFMLAEHIQFGDADNDQQDEILLASKDKLFLINPNTFQVEMVIGKSPGEFGLGNVDSDENLELVFSNGEIFDLSVEGIISEYTLPLERTLIGSTFELVDMDEDSQEEILFKDGLGLGIQVFDAELESLQKEVHINLPMTEHSLKDIIDDGAPGSVYRSDSQIFVYDYYEKNEIRQLGNPAFPSIKGMVVGDFDGDGELEVSRGAGCVDSGENLLQVFNLSSRELEWESSLNPDSTYPIEAEKNNESVGESIIQGIKASSNSSVTPPAVVVSPNPIEGQFFVEFEEANPMVKALSLIRQDGKVKPLSFSPFGKKTLQVSFERIISGAYLLKIDTKDQSYYHRVIIL